MVDPKYRKDTEKYIANKPEWTVYSLSSHLGLKAAQIYMKLDQKSRLMLIKEGRLRACHATVGLYPLLEKERLDALSKKL